MGKSLCKTCQKILSTDVDKCHLCGDSDPFNRKLIKNSITAFRFRREINGGWQYIFALPEIFIFILWFGGEINWWLAVPLALLFTGIMEALENVDLIDEGSYLSDAIMATKESLENFIKANYNNINEVNSWPKESYRIEQPTRNFIDEIFNKDENLRVDVENLIIIYIKMDERKEIFKRAIKSKFN